MSRLPKFLIALCFAAAAFAATHARADAAACTIPYPSFVNNISFVTAPTTNANNAALVACFENLDNTNINSTGLFPSQLNPTTTLNGTVGGTVAVTFPHGIILPSPLPVSSGGLGPQSVIPAYPAGTQFVFFGDSLTYGYGINGQTSYGCTVSPPSSPCFADLVTTYYSGSEVNLGLPGSMLQTTSDATAASGYSRYTTTLLPYCSSATNAIVIFYGSNDYHTSDTSASPAAFQTDLGTIVNACEAAGALPQNITLLAPTFQDDSTALFGQSDVMGVMDRYKLAVAKVAEKYGTRFADVSDALANGAGAGLLTAQGQSLLTDNIHPTNAGHAIIAQQVEGALWVSAFAYDAAMNAMAAREKNGWRTTGPITCGTNYGGRGPNGNCEFRLTSSTGTEFLFQYPVPSPSSTPLPMIDMNNTDGSLTMRPQTASTAAAQMSGPINQCGTTTGSSFAVNCATQQADSVGDEYFKVLTGDSFFWDVNNAVQMSLSTGGGLSANVPIVTTKINQQATNEIGKLVNLSTGVVTWTFTTPYNNAPICTATEENGSSVVSVRITSKSATAVTVQSSTTTGNTDPVDIICIGNPN